MATHTSIKRERSGTSRKGEGVKRTHGGTTEPRAIGRKRVHASKIVLHACFVLVSIACVYPLLLVFSVSFSTERDVVAEGYRIIPKHISLDGYRFIFNEGFSIIRAYGISIFVTLAGTLLSTLVVALYAYPLSRADFRMRKAFSFIVLFPLLFNPGFVPWYVVCTRVLLLKNTYLALILPYVMNIFNTLVMRTFFSQSVHPSLIESAKMDGAGEYRILKSIVAPIALPGLATIAFFSCLLYWNDYRLPLYLITEMKKFNIQYLMWQVQSNIQVLSTMSGTGLGSNVLKGLPGETARMGICILAIGPIVLAYPFFRRFFVEGLTLGSIKG